MCGGGGGGGGIGNLFVGALSTVGTAVATKMLAPDPPEYTPPPQPQFIQPAPPPPEPEPPAKAPSENAAPRKAPPQQQSAGDSVTKTKKKKTNTAVGRSALRIDRTFNVGSTGSGLQIPTSTKES